MNGIISDVEIQGKAKSPPSFDPNDSEVHRECHGCGETKPDVDVWARNDEAEEEILLCEICGEW